MKMKKFNDMLEIDISINSFVWPIQNGIRKLKNDWNAGKWVIIRQYSVRAMQ